MYAFDGYPKYEDAKSLWIDELPVGWTRAPIKYCVSVRVTDGPHMTPDFLSEGVPFLSAEAVKKGALDFSKKRGYISESDHRLFSQKCLPVKGDVLMVKSGNTTGAIAIVETDEVFNIWSPLALIRGDQKKFVPQYVYFAVMSGFFQTSVSLSSSYGTQPNIGMGVIENLQLPCPSTCEQQKIAQFLDHETAKIDTLIEKQQQLIALLKEKRQAVISHAVTKGLDPNAEMRDSGVEWLGEVPVGWVVSGFTKYIESIVDYRGKTPKKTEVGVFLVTARNIKNGQLNYTLSQEYISEADYPSVMSRGIPEIGDVLFTTEAPLGEVAAVDRTDIALAQRVVKFRGNKEKLSNDFLLYFIMSSCFQASS